MKLFLILVAILLSTILAGCTTASEEEVRVEVSCDEFYDIKHIYQTLEVKPEESFKVKLCSNPTTGFKWTDEAQISDLTVLKQEDHNFIGPDSNPPPPPGTPGQEVWTFKARQAGASKIYLEYSRPWEGGEKGEWTCTIEVIVKEPSVSTPDDNRGNKETTPLENTAWILQSYGEKENPADVIPGTKITAEFKSDESKITGSGGCNNYFGGYQIEGSKLTIGPYIASTEMACLEPEGLMDQEYKYLRILETAEDYQIQEEKLVINCGVNILVFAAE